MSIEYVALEIDTYDTGSSSVVTRYISNAGTLIRSSGGAAQYDPRLRTFDISISQAIMANDYGQVSRASPPGGTIEFAVDPSIWAWFGPTIHWLGRAVRLYSGTSATGNVSDLMQRFAGIITNLSVDSAAAHLTIEESSAVLDDALVTDFYTTGALETLVGLPKPQVWGTVSNVAPVLEDQANLIYRVSRLALNSVTAVRVGGIAWTKVTTTPIASQWKDLGDGTIMLGGTPLGGEVRCDARSSDYASMTTAFFIDQVVTAKGLTTNTAAMSQLDSDFGALIGYYTTTQPINASEALDDVTTGGGCYWGLNPAGEIVAGVIAAPGSASVTLDDVATVSSQITDLVPPAWRIRVEHTRNWAPQTTFYPEVSADDQAKWNAPGLVAPEWSDATIKTAEPRAIDVALIRSLVQSESDATDIRDRLMTAWSVSRKLYDVETRVSAVPAALYDSALLDASLFNATGRVTSITPALGGGSARLQLWG